MLQLPLQELVHIAEERQVDIPALVYEARPVRILTYMNEYVLCIAWALYKSLELTNSIMANLASDRIQARRDPAEHLHEVASDSAWAHALRPRRMHDVAAGSAMARPAGQNGLLSGACKCVSMLVRSC